jgi:probable phosphoglycerate mutase
LKQHDLFHPTVPPRQGVAVIANIDGGSRGNPGPAAYGVLIRNSHGKVLAKLGEYLGRQTNNVAEYSGLLAALDWAVRENQPSLKVLSDSELLVRQMRGQYKVKDPDLKELFGKAQSLARKLQHFTIEHVRRESNREADRLVNNVLDRQSR